MRGVHFVDLDLDTGSINKFFSLCHWDTSTHPNSKI
jgi:hypothetical protein